MYPCAMKQDSSSPPLKCSKRIRHYIARIGDGASSERTAALDAADGRISNHSMIQARLKERLEPARVVPRALLL